MVRFRGLPGAALAVGAFVLTVLLGLGGAPASALWQQSATATMTVSAASTWPGPSFQAHCSGFGSPYRSVRITASLPQNARSVTISASRPNGSFSQPEAMSVFGTLAFSTVAVTDDILSGSGGMTLVTLRVTATYSDQTEYSDDLTVRMDGTTSNRKIYCS
ncbi:MAG: hypothetical protein ABWY04_17460 [Arthrobacter sp.]